MNRFDKLGLWLCGLLLLLGCSRPVKPSVLITDEELLRKFNSEALPTNYHVLARTTSWNLDGRKGRFERSFASTVLELDNAPVDPQLVSDQFEAWLATLVKVVASAADTNRPPAIGRIIQYTAAQTTGDLRYTLKPVPGAKLTVNGKESPGKFQGFNIQFVEERKR